MVMLPHVRFEAQPERLSRPCVGTWEQAAVYRIEIFPWQTVRPSSYMDGQAREGRGNRDVCMEPK